jgi:hypothetical protein
MSPRRKLQLSQLVKKALDGEQVVIAKLVRAVRRRRPGSAKGQVTMSKNFRAPLEDFRERFVVHQCDVNGFHLLPLTLAHIGLVELLPFHHRDPFDQILVAQARIEGMTLTSRDPALKAYGISIA